MLKILIFLVFVTSSFDILLNLNLGGFNVRTCYLAAFAFIFIYAGQFKDASRFRFIGIGSFLIWFLFITAFVWNTQFLMRNIGYVAWLCFNMFACYAIYKYSQLKSANDLIRIYVLSFFVMALVGLAQFMLSTVGIHVLITMWWKINKIPRVNALSYEPSYYATYLLIGFVFLYFTQRRGIWFFKQKMQILILSTVAIAIFLSTSRMGILFMVSILLYDFAKLMIRALFTWRISRVNFFIAIFFIGAMATVVGRILIDEKQRKLYLAGTGIESTASHSKDARIWQMNNVLLIFQESPIVGYSLGGIAPAIAKHYSNKTTDLKKAKEYEGLNIFLEVLAASGIFGFLFFCSWLFQLFRANIKLSGILRLHGYARESGILDALRYALIAELLILVLSQNILRPYLWILIGVTNALYFRFKDQLNKVSTSQS
ncbi:MAG TPA: O-antigen ligase family protein [Catalimonadaceae bacterium]|nr:O-antigen ligase family protein [Catalimonadaceae bacterium]HPI10864.1 O-antigen ligase family protein [Catalimonadaceae bacterium]